MCARATCMCSCMCVCVIFSLLYVEFQLIVIIQMSCVVHYDWSSL